MFLADTLSRAFPVSETVRDDSEMLNIVHTISKHLPMSEKGRVQFKKETELDPELRIVVKYIKEDPHFERKKKEKKDSVNDQLEKFEKDIFFALMGLRIGIFTSTDLVHSPGADLTFYTHVHKLRIMKFRQRKRPKQNKFD
ncbi:integrase_H2C2 domain-containing protein [Trichonephila clavipes]|nr:integrase_H2C2 domain-containing protein [Trichonephila clavipes]